MELGVTQNLWFGSQLRKIGNNNNNNFIITYYYYYYSVATLRTCECDTSATAEMREQMWFTVTIVDTGSILTTPTEMVLNPVTKAY